MKHIQTIVFTFIIILSLVVHSTIASYIDDGEILILRSQYTENNSIILDGVLNEELWATAGELSLEVDGLDGVSITSIIDMRYTNDDDVLFFSISTTNTNFLYAQFGVYFDVLGDGVLSFPEDGKSWIYNTTTGEKTSDDLYWSGSDWANDGGLSTTSSFGAGGNLTNAVLTIEFKIDLLSSDLVYDGLQVPSTSNVFLAMAFHLYLERIDGSVDFQFPTSIDNATGFIDLKLAGPEDKDLPTYIPPTQITTTLTDTSTTTTIKEGAAALSAEDEANSLSFSGFIVSLMFIYLTSIAKRRRRR